MENATETLVETEATPVVTTTGRKGKRENSPSAEQFVRVWNRSTSRQNALDNFKEDGFHMTYTAMAARVKSYSEKGAALKDMPAGKRGRKNNFAEINAKIAAEAGAEAIAGK